VHTGSEKLFRSRNMRARDSSDGSVGIAVVIVKKNSRRPWWTWTWVLTGKMVSTVVRDVYRYTPATQPTGRGGVLGSNPPSPSWVFLMCKIRRNNTSFGLHFTILFQILQFIIYTITQIKNSFVIYIFCNLILDPPRPPQGIFLVALLLHAHASVERSNLKTNANFKRELFETVRDGGTFDKSVKNNHFMCGNPSRIWTRKKTVANYVNYDPRSTLYNSNIVTNNYWLVTLECQRL